MKKMADIKLINEQTDLSKLRNPLKWDLEINGVPYDIYRVEGYNHTIGGKYGENNLWACPSGEKPTYQNLIEFDGDAPTWGVTFDRVNYIKSKWDETEVRCNGVCWITRNGKKFYRISGRYMDYALAKAQYYLVKLQEELPLWISERGWEQQAEGMKIYYYGKPAVIKYVTSSNELMLDVEDEGSECVDLLDPHIRWFRD